MPLKEGFMNNQGFIKIDRTGKTLVFGESLKRSLSHQAGYYSLKSCSQEQVSFSRVPSIPRYGELREPIIFQGDIGGIGSTIEVVNFVISAKLTGQLTLVKGDVRKSLFIDQGELSAARSNHLDDRLSEVLFRFGALDREAIDEAEEACSQSKQPLGNYLIKQGILEQAQLFLYFKKQVEDIFYSILHWNFGEFYFTVSHFNDNPTPLKINAQQLLLEGVRRADEMKRYRTLFSSPQVIVEFVRSSEELNDELKAILSYIQTPRSLKQLIDYFRVGEFNIYQRVFKLVNQGYLKLADNQQSHEQKLSNDELVMLFNRTFSMIHQFAKKSGSDQSLNLGLDVFKSFYQHDGLLEGISFDDKGRLRQESLLTKLANTPNSDGFTYLGQALCELLYFQIFTARNWLSNEEHGQLQDVYEEISSLITV
ncbi:MAG: hypothetical protein CMH49_08980 [Myxococcales bacterium]|nr:hypothetical protein [Myxococcales bacterium]